MIVGHLLMFFGVIVIAYAVITAATSSGKLDPAKLGGDLAGALSRGDRDRCRKIIDKLPDWKVRSRLRDAADGTADLRRATPPPHDWPASRPTISARWTR